MVLGKKLEDEVFLGLKKSAKHYPRPIQGAKEEEGLGRARNATSNPLVQYKHPRKSP